MKKKKVIRLLLIVIFIIIFAFTVKKVMHMTCWIGDYKCRFNMQKKEAYIVEYRGDGNVVLPKKILFCDVIGYRDEVFSGNDVVENVYISNNPKDDTTTSFSECKNLTKVTYEEGMKASNRYIFAGCEKLDTVIFPEGIEYIYGVYAFAGTNVADVDIPSSVKYLDGMFGNTPFDEKHKGDKYYVAGEGVLVFYNGPEDEIVIPKGIKSVGGHVLSLDERSKNASIYVSDSVEILHITLAKGDTLYLGNGKYEFDTKNTYLYYNGSFVAPAGSYMEQYCAENNLNFRVMTEEEEAIWREKTEAAASEIVYQE